MTAGESITVRVAEALEACGIPFLLSGSFASNLGLHRGVVPAARYPGVNAGNTAFTSGKMICQSIRPMELLVHEFNYCQFRE
jgi:hypothetical protein